jgi:hypothetical protein
MKKVLLLLTFCVFTSLYAHSQFYLGITEAEVKSQIKENTGRNTEIQKINSYGAFAYAIVWHIDANSDGLVAFEKSGYSSVFTITPKTDKYLKAMIEIHNERFVKVTDNEWKAYVKGKVFKVELRYYRDQYSFFISEKSGN